MRGRGDAGPDRATGAAGIASPLAFPWDDVLAFCLGEMRLAPDIMWAATPREIAAMLRGRRRVTHPGAVPPPRRDDFAALRALYPDSPTPRQTTAKETDA